MQFRSSKKHLGILFICRSSLAFSEDNNPSSAVFSTIRAINYRRRFCRAFPAPAEHRLANEARKIRENAGEPVARRPTFPRDGRFVSGVPVADPLGPVARRERRFLGSASAGHQPDLQPEEKPDFAAACSRVRELRDAGIGRRFIAIVRRDARHTGCEIRSSRSIRRYVT